MTSILIARGRRGIALPTALFALVVIGALVGGIFFVAHIEIKSGDSSMAGARATAAAQGGLQVGYPQVLALAGDLGDGASVTGTRTRIGASASYYQITVTRLNQSMYLLRSTGEYEGRAGIVSARRTVAQLVKRYRPELDLRAAATVVGAPNIGGSVQIDGRDHTPSGWTDCAPPGDGVPGIRTGAATANVQRTDNIITDDPTEVVTRDTSARRMAAVLDTLFHQLATQAGITLAVADGATLSADPDPDAAGRCDQATTNWGDPTRNAPAHACEAYFPIVYIHPASTGVERGAVKLHLVGEGVLLVDGDLVVEGGSNYVGLILVRGGIGAAHGYSTLTGGVVALGADLDAFGSNGAEDLRLRYSRCGIERALDHLVVSAPIRDRGFIQF